MKLRDWLPNDRPFAAWVRDVRAALFEHDETIATKLDKSSSVDLVLSGSAEVLYSTPRSTTVVIDASAGFQASGAASVQWKNRTGMGLQSNTNAGFSPLYLRQHVFIPDGALLTRCRALVKPALAEATSANRMKLDGGYYTPDLLTPANPSSTAMWTTVTDDGTANYQWIDSGEIAVTISNLSAYEVGISSSSDGAANADFFLALAVTFDDPGPRNR